MNEAKALETIYDILAQNFGQVEPRCLEEITRRIDHMSIDRMEILFDTFTLKLIAKE